MSETTESLHAAHAMLEAEVDRLRRLLKEARHKVAAERESASRSKGKAAASKGSDIAARQLSLQVHVLQRRLIQEQQARQTEV